MKRFIRNSVKEAFDNLPSGICFFDKNGILTLCNHQMYRLFFALTGKDLQSLSELQEFLNDNTAKSRENQVFLQDDKTAWRFALETVTTPDNKIYTQVIASDVTELYSKTKELEQDNIALAEYAKRMRRLFANTIALIREEEILNMKMRVHDDIGRSVISARRFLQQNRPMEELDLIPWKNVVSLLRHEIELSEEQDAVAGLMSAAYSIGIKIILEGNLPKDIAGEVLIAAIRECMTNAVRHAGAKELYVHITGDENTAVAVITNNGAVPNGEISLGGGLTSLKLRIEKCGGTMRVKHSPQFELTVSVPLKTEEKL
ncbi:MAG: ATP-binding protein [Clostridia bacterium]|nr:ATP-binding protein [Clostridia bacterium]